MNPWEPYLHLVSVPLAAVSWAGIVALAWGVWRNVGVRFYR